VFGRFSQETESASSLHALAQKSSGNHFSFWSYHSQCSFEVFSRDSQKVLRPDLGKDVPEPSAVCLGCSVGFREKFSVQITTLLACFRAS
jgi:hypothetical protein